MSENTLKARYKHPVKTAARWTEENPILLTGEIGVESDTGKCKAGDGISRWNSLGYLTPPVDNALSATSENPVQNKVIKGALDEKASTQYVDDAIAAIVDLDGEEF